MAPLCLQSGRGAMERSPLLCKAFADLPHWPSSPLEAFGGAELPRGFLDRQAGSIFSRLKYVCLVVFWGTEAYFFFLL